MMEQGRFPPENNSQDVALWPSRTKKGREDEELFCHLGGTFKLPYHMAGMRNCKI